MFIKYLVVPLWVVFVLVGCSNGGTSSGGVETAPLTYDQVNTIVQKIKLMTFSNTLYNYIEIFPCKLAVINMICITLLLSWYAPKATRDVTTSQICYYYIYCKWKRVRLNLHSKSYTVIANN